MGLVKRNRASGTNLKQITIDAGKERWKKLLKIRKAPLSVHRIMLRNRQRGRFYVNDSGERYKVERKILFDGKEKDDIKTYKVLIHPDKRTTIETTSIIRVRKDEKMIELIDISISGHVLKNRPPEERGRGMFQAILDECRQMGLKEFRNQKYQIVTIPINNEVMRYYLKFGFVVKNRFGDLVMYINEKGQIVTNG